MPTSISFIISANNNEKQISRTFASVVKAINKLDLQFYEIILVDNASKDKTTTIMKKIVSKNLNTKYLHEHEIGLSKAFYKGIQQSNCDFCLPLPGHNMYPAESIYKVCKLAKKNEIILGCRKSKLKNRPIFKALASFIFVKLCNIIFKLKVKDINGLIIFPTSKIKKVLESNAGHGHALIPLVRLSRSGVKIKQVEIDISRNHKNINNLGVKWRFPKISNVLSTIKSICILIKEH